MVINSRLVRVLAGLVALMSACTDSAADAPTQVVINIDGPGRVFASGVGIECAQSCQFDAQTRGPLSLTAVPDRGASFARWSGACTDKQGMCTVPTEARVEVSAHFDLVCPSPWLTAANDNIVDMDTHPSGWVVTTGDSTVLYDVFICQPIWSSPAPGTHVRFDRLGNIVLADNQLLTVLSGANGTELWQVQLGGAVQAMDITDDDRIIAATAQAGNARLHRIRIRDGFINNELTLGQGQVAGLVVDQQDVWVAGQIEQIPSVQYYDVLSLESKGSVQVSDLDEISALSILPESSVVLGGSLAGEHTVITFDTSYSEVDRIDLPMAPILVGRFVITAQVLDLVQGTILTTLEQQPEAAASDETFLYLAGQSGISRVQ